VCGRESLADPLAELLEPRHCLFLTQTARNDCNGRAERPRCAVFVYEPNQTELPYGRSAICLYRRIPPAPHARRDKSLRRLDRHLANPGVITTGVNVDQRYELDVIPQLIDREAEHHPGWVKFRNVKVRQLPPWCASLRPRRTGICASLRLRAFVPSR